nr:hypothetical protein [uncultured Lachnoclostridium sp.]
MGYEVKKVIEFGRENTKPVGLLKGAILLKDGTEQVLQLKLRNNGKDVLNRVTVKITCIGKDGQAVGVQSYTYEKLFVVCGEEFGSNIPIMLQYSDVEQVEVKIEDDYRNLKVSSKSIQKQPPKSSYNIFVCVVSMVTLLAGIYSTCGLFYYTEIWSTLVSQMIFNIMYLYGITQYILAASKMPFRRLYSLNFVIVTVNGIYMLLLIIIGLELGDPWWFSGLFESYQQIAFAVNSILMLIALAKYCDKKYLCLIILFVLLGSGPIFATLLLHIYYRGTYIPNLQLPMIIFIILGLIVRMISAVLGGGLVASKKFKLR